MSRAAASIARGFRSRTSQFSYVNIIPSGYNHSHSQNHSSHASASDNCRRHFRSSAAALKEDYYKTLGVSKSASKDEIKKSYRELAKKYHPDMNKDPGSDKMFQRVTEAYEVLESEEKRGLYDSYGHQGVDPNYQQSGGGGGGPFGGFGGGGFGGFQGGGSINVDDLFDMINNQMGGMGGGAGRDVESKVRISFEEAVRGCTKEINFEYIVKEPKGSAKGRQRFEKVRKKRKVSIDIPAGVDTGIQVCACSLLLPSLTCSTLPIIVISYFAFRSLFPHSSFCFIPVLPFIFGLNLYSIFAALLFCSPYCYTSF
jgi:curved DNA-binding protein CbpA